MPPDGGSVDGPPLNGMQLTWGDSFTFSPSEQLVKSIQGGVLQYFKTEESSEAFSHNGAPLVIDGLVSM